MDKQKQSGDKNKIALIIILSFILVIIVALAYFGSFNAAKLRQDQCVSTAGIECKSYEIDLTNDRLSLAFINNLGQSITLSDVNISYKGKTVSTCDALGQIMNFNGTQISSENPVQPEHIFMFRNCTLTTTNTPLSGKRPGDKVKLDFSFNYLQTGENEFPHLAYGSVTATATGSRKDIMRNTVSTKARLILKYAVIILIILSIYIFLIRKLLNEKENGQKIDKQKESITINKSAIYSIVFCVLGIFALLFIYSEYRYSILSIFIYPLLSIAGIILGFKSLNEIKNSDNNSEGWPQRIQKKGKILAKIGIILGIIELTYFIFIYNPLGP